MRAYHGADLGRLERVKGKYDPDGFFRFHQSVPARAPGSAVSGRDKPTMLGRSRDDRS